MYRAQAHPYDMTDKDITRYGRTCDRCGSAFTSKVPRNATFEKQVYERLCVDCVYEVYDL